MSKRIDFSNIPAPACLLAGGKVEAGSNGDNAKTAPVRLVARSAQPIEHWFWGRVVHDLSGMKMHKDRLPLDFCHDDKDVIGFLNRFEITDEGLVCSGALVPFKGENDSASKIIHHLQNDVPYEASINFGGDGMRYEEIAEGQIAPVNGYEFEGPGIIIREWPLRGVAVCPYGADMNTESAANFAAGKTYKGVNIMSEEVKRDEEVKKEDIKQDAVVDGKTQAESAEAEAKDESADGKAPESEAVDAKDEKTEPETASEAEAVKAELKALRDEFGAEIAVEAVLSGAGRSGALKAQNARLKAENEAIRKQLASKQEDGVAPVKFSEAPESDAPKNFKETLAAAVRNG